MKEEKKMEQKEGRSSDRKVTADATELRTQTAAGNASYEGKLRPLLQ